MAIPPLTGRNELLSALEPPFARGHHLLLRGPAGIGKTRLANELTTVAQSERLSVDRLLASEATAQFQLGALASLGRPTGVAAGDLPALMSWYLGRWRSQRRHDRPPVVWIDDLHQIDDLSASVIRQAIALGCVQLLATHRTPAPLPADIEALVIEGQLEVVDVPPLDAAMTTELAEATAQRQLTSAQSDAMLSLSAGVPLYVRDLALAIGSSDDPPQITDLSDALGARFAGLSAEDRRTVEMIAATEPIDLDFLRDRRAGVMSLIDAGLVRRQGTSDVRLEHPLYGTWLLDSLGPLVTELYRELAERAGDPSTGAAVEAAQELAWRLKAGDEPDDQLVTEGTRLAIGRSDGATALRFLEGRTGFDLLRGQALLLSDDFEAGIALLEHVRLTSTPHERAEAASWLARYVGVGLQDYERAHQILEEADDPSLDLATRQLLMIGQVWMWMFGPGVPVDIDQRVTDVLDLDAADAASYELAMAGIGLIYQVHEPARAVPLMNHVHWIEERVEIDPNSICRARCIEGWLHIFSGRPRRGVQLMHDHFEFAKAQRNAEGMALIGGTCGLVAALTGQIQLSVQLAQQGAAAVEGQDWFRYGAITHEVGRGSSLLAGLPRVGPSPADGANVPNEGPSFADLENLFRVRADVLDLQRRNVPVDETPLLDAFELVATNNKLAWLATLPPEYLDRSTPRSVHALLLSAFDPNRTDAVHRLARQLCSARLDGRHDDLLAVAAQYESLGFTPAASRAFADVTVLEPVDSPLRPAAIQGVLRSLRHWDGGPTWWTAEIADKPTARQLEIMWRVVDGERPPDVARQLDLSTRTVENHLYRVYRSLGVSGQEELVAVMSDPPLE